MRQYDLKGLTQVQAKCAALVSDVRDARHQLQAELKELDSPASKAKFTAAHLNEERASRRRAALQKVQSLNRELAELSRQAALERHEWSREALLASTDATVDTTDRQTRILARLEASMRRMELASRLGRMTDDNLLDYATRAAEQGDALGVSMASEEGKVRTGVTGLRTAQLLAQLPCPEADQSAMIYDQLERDLREASAVEETIEYPDDNRSYATVRSLEIARATAEEGQGDEKKEDEGTHEQLSSDAPDIDFSSFIRPGTDAA